MTSLVFALLFLGISAIWALNKYDVIGDGDWDVVGPAVLVGAGLVGLAASLASMLRRSQRNDDTRHDDTRHDDTRHDDTRHDDRVAEVGADEHPIAVHPANDDPYDDVPHAEAGPQQRPGTSS